jgi:transposase
MIVVRGYSADEFSSLIECTATGEQHSQLLERERAHDADTTRRFAELDRTLAVEYSQAADCE